MQNRFDCDFGMMKAGSDVDDMWHNMEVGLRWVLPVLLLQSRNWSCCRAVGVISHVPWAFPLVESIPFSGQKFYKLKQFGKRCARTRIRKGSKNKDLFYYLVSWSLYYSCGEF